MLFCLFNTDILDDNRNNGSAFPSIYLIKLTLSSLTSSFSMAKFLQVGPCKLIPQNKLGIGMFLITITNSFGLWWKVISISGASILYICEKNPSCGLTPLFFELFWRSCCLQLLPGMILVNFKTFLN